MLHLIRKGRTIIADTFGGRVVIDADSGGQLVALDVKDELFRHPLAPAGRTIPSMQFEIDGRRTCLDDVRAEMEIVVQETDFVRILTRAPLGGGALALTQEYEIHEEGILFSHLSLEVPSGRKVVLGDCSLTVALDLTSACRGRWGHFMRDSTFKRDFTNLHALPKFNGALPLDRAADVRELLPLVSLDLGWEATRFFSNHLEFFIEDWASVGDGPREDQTATQVGDNHGLWQVRWQLFRGKPAVLQGPYRYRNRWGLVFGRARTAAGPQTDPAVRNNALGAKVCHLKVPYGRQGNRWPWVSMPIKQVADQSDQIFVENPPVSCVDEAADLGADLMVVHQFWMRNPGSNNEPVADYQPKDPRWLRAFTKRCHARGMRVLYYARGTEMWCQFSPFFEQFLEKDRDGIYVDWNTPFAMGAARCSPLHVSLHNYFHFTKAVRERVGKGGLMIGHAGFANLVSLACFDVLLGGETSVRHDELLTNPESSAYYAHLDCCGAHLIGGNQGERKAFASVKAGAVCAALGMTSQVNMEPGTSFADRVAFIKPLWDAMSCLTGKIVRYHNPAYAPTRAVATEAPDLYPSLWQTDDGQALLLVTNLGEQAASGTVRVRRSELDVPAGATLRVLPIAGTFAGARVKDGVVTLTGLPSCQYTAILIGTPPRRGASGVIS